MLPLDVLRETNSSSFELVEISTSILLFLLEYFVSSSLLEVSTFSLTKELSYSTHFPLLVL